MPHPHPDAPAADPQPPGALDPLFALVYDELRRAAHHHLHREPDGHTLCTTALVHEVYLRLAVQEHAQWRGRGHFLSIASQAMRRVLIDHARRHLAAKRGGGQQRVSLDDATVAVEDQAETLVALDLALTRLRALDERMARVVECRFFAGLSDEETADVLGVTPRTIWRDWVKAKGWLHRELHG